MKILCDIFLIFLIVGTLTVIGGFIYTMLTYKRDKSKVYHHNDVNPFDFDV